ncbi:MAG: hypothetical protein KGP12_10010 [Actinomycetales bacterium]|nr:hypothetical protein [Actinomycetales bacterium]
MVSKPDLADDRGSGAVLMIAVLALVCFGASVGYAKAQLIVAQRHAAGAADLAALAGASATIDPCARAAAVAGANDAHLTGCAIDGADVVVEVSRPMPALTAQVLHAFRLPAAPIIARARAGQPASS